MKTGMKIAFFIVTVAWFMVGCSKDCDNPRVCTNQCYAPDCVCHGNLKHCDNERCTWGEQ